MCGIVGYTGMHEASPILVAGLRRLEYRGYDSAGLAALEDGRLEVRKRAGRVRVLEEMLEQQPLRGPVRDQPHAMGHARTGHRSQCPSPPGRPRQPARPSPSCTTA